METSAQLSRRGDKATRSVLGPVPFVVAILSGLSLLIVPLAKGEVRGSRAADKLVRQASPILTRPGLTALCNDLVTMSGDMEALNQIGIPRLAALSGATTAQFTDELTRSDPAVAQGLQQFPAIKQQTDAIVSNLERRRGQFESAAALPGAMLSLNHGVWVGLALGTGLVIFGIVGQARRRRWMAGMLAVVGLGLVLGPLALGYPAKTADADALPDSLRPFSVQKVGARETSEATIRAILSGLRNDVVPRTALKAGLTPASVLDDLGSADPRLSPAALQQADVVVDRFASLVAASATFQPLLVDATHLPSRALTWLLVLPEQRSSSGVRSDGELSSEGEGIH